MKENKRFIQQTIRCTISRRDLMNRNWENKQEKVLEEHEISEEQFNEHNKPVIELLSKIYDEITITEDK